MVASDIPTNEQLDRARQMGERHARAEQALDVLFPSDPISDEEDIRSLAFRVTGAKLEPTSFAAEMIAATYEEGYWEVWDAD